MKKTMLKFMDQGKEEEAQSIMKEMMHKKSNKGNKKAKKVEQFEICTPPRKGEKVEGTPSRKGEMILSSDSDDAMIDQGENAGDLDQEEQEAQESFLGSGRAAKKRRRKLQKAEARAALKQETKMKANRV